MTVEAAEQADLAGAQRVWLRANTARGKVPDERRIARVTAKLADPAALVVVARTSDTVVGMVLAEPGRDRDGAGEPLPDLCHVSMVFVDPEVWGRGIGRLLLAEAVRLAEGRGYRLLQLWTGQRNLAARRLYEIAGFTPSGREASLPSGERILHLVLRTP